ncbi:hypothetical protein LCGC14_2647550 [marine sediment metagenome]|uniref:Uncharacterized protein n=1 Tax=marine sediment metagenome TaxID=412755 RepID=A0A0F9C683_9ZZZZ
MEELRISKNYKKICEYCWKEYKTAALKQRYCNKECANNARKEEYSIILQDNINRVMILRLTGMIYKKSFFILFAALHRNE